LDELVGNRVVVALGDSFEMLVHLISEYYKNTTDRGAMTMREILGRKDREQRGKARTGGLVFRMRFHCALSCFDSYALERRLWSGLLLRHPRVSNQNSKRADSIRRER
jgi:hypothetical protein